ncbi:MAG: nickel pincer cofactor biosynthesis protein LarB [Halobacteriota archaeon]
MRDTLRALSSGDISIEEAQVQLAGYATTDAGRFDAARETRRGVPETILADGKTAAEILSLALTALETSDRAIVTRLDETDASAVIAELADDVSVDHDPRARTLVLKRPSFEPPSLEADVAVLTGGTSDLAVAGEAVTIAREIGATVELIVDVGVANLSRVVDQLDTLRSADVLIVAAGREGALPTVVAGLVNTPVIGLPVSSGYGAGGDGEAALYGMLQSCTVISVVNIDAGYIAGAQAGLIARQIDAARSE